MVDFKQLYEGIKKKSVELEITYEKGNNAENSSQNEILAENKLFFKAIKTLEINIIQMYQKLNIFLFSNDFNTKISADFITFRFSFYKGKNKTYPTEFFSKSMKQEEIEQKLSSIKDFIKFLNEK